MAFLADDDAVMHGDGQRLGDVGNRLRHLNIGPRGYVIHPALSLVLAGMVPGYLLLPLLFPLLAGFALMGPFTAPGLYELSRRRDLGEGASPWQATKVLRSPSFGAVLGLGSLLLAIFVVWVATAQVIYVSTFGTAPSVGIPHFAAWALTTPEGWELIVVGCSVGFLFAVVALCISVVSFPLIHDRHASAADAITISFRAVAKNPVPMAAWGLIVAVLLLLGSMPLFWSRSCDPAARPFHLASLSQGGRGQSEPAGELIK